MQATSVTCNKAATVEDALKQSSQFRESAKKIKDKELLMVRQGKAVSSHFPCSLIHERINVKSVKVRTTKKPRSKGSVLPSKKGRSSELITFNILTKGGKNVSRILRNPAITSHVQEITIYGYKGETVKEALRRDDHILKPILKKNCALFNVRTEVNTEMSNLVDDLDGQTFRITLLNNKCLPDSQATSSLDDDYMARNECIKPDSDSENQNPQQAAKTKSENETMFHQIPNSEKMVSELFKQFTKSVKGKKTGVSKGSRIRNLYSVKYRNSDQAFKEVKTMKKLMDLSRYVCQVRINGRPKGSGFLLFDRFVLTNAHVLEGVYNEKTCLRGFSVTVNFSFESVEQSDGIQESGGEVSVEHLVGIEYSVDPSGHKYDWALLELNKANLKLHDGLLPQFGFLPSGDEICVIGHPEGAVKQINSCLMIQPKDRMQVVETHFQFISPQFFDDASELVDRINAITYRHCFSYGSSGSPVFDKYCRVVAMHSGGYVGKQEKGPEAYLIDYGYPLSSIIEHIIVQLVQMRKFDVLRAYLACKYTHQQDMMVNVKKLVESRNITAFKHALSISGNENDKTLKEIFEFFCLKDQPVPMDTNV